MNNRIEYLLLTSVTNGNPNGDPDMGNRPRMDDETGHCIITDASTKRKVRDFVISEIDKQGYDIFIQSGTPLNTKIDAAAAPFTVGETVKSGDAVKAMCQQYYDIRTFGAVLSTGALKGASDGQVRGPVQIGFGRSVHPVNPTEITITRCAVTTEADAKKERTMGSKWIVPYALIAQPIFVNPAYANRVGFTDEDLKILERSIINMFTNDKAAARAECNVVRLYKIVHPIDENGASYGAMSFGDIKAMLAPKLKDGVTYPREDSDYIYADNGMSRGDSQEHHSGFVVSRLV